MKYDNHRKFRHELVKILDRSKISQSPLRESFITLSWRKYNSQDRKIKLFKSFLEKFKYEDLKKKMLKAKAWGSYLYLITDGDPKKLL